MDAINKKYLATVVFNLCELEKEVAERLSFKFSSYDVFDEFDRIFSEFRIDSKVNLYPAVAFKMGAYQKEDCFFGFGRLIMYVFDAVLREQGVKDDEIVWLNCDKEATRFE